jgi:hydroxymethylglutaryl-CoA reductase (NADPH)
MSRPTPPAKNTSAARFPRWPRGNTSHWIAERQERLRALAHWGNEYQHVLDGQLDALAPFQECLTGQMTLPVGVVGPLRLNWGQYELDRHGQLHERGRQEDRVFVPLAHTEGGLSASIQRGVTAVALAGGVRTYVLADRITRDSCFVFSSTREALALADWVAAHAADMAAWLKDSAHSALPGHLLSRHALLHEVQTHVVGPMCHVLYRFTTGDACGPNMMTRNAYALNHAYISERFAAESGIRPLRVFLEANMGGDKKPSHAFFQFPGHGKLVHAEMTLPHAVLRRVLRVEAADILALEHAGLHGAHASGMQSFAFTPASAIAAIFAATGQDLGMVGTSSMAQVTVSPVSAGLHLSIRFAGLEVGTLGGGTSLPQARAYLQLLDCWGEGKVYRFAQIIAATALCLELSAAASMAADGSRNFLQAHLERGGLRASKGEKSDA